MKINTDLTLKHYSYPSIEQFRTVIHNVNHRACYIGKDENGEAIIDLSRAKPKLTFIGTTKLHGTNAAIVINYKESIIYFQSRENIIIPTKDNAGFALQMASIQDKIVDLIKTEIADYNIVVIYGEWCGASIQKGVAISQLPKMFVIFDIALIEQDSTEKKWLSQDVVSKVKLPENRIFNIYDFPQWQIEIDFTYPQLSQNALVELTTKIEEECPVGKYFGVSGTGEGIVWKCINEGFEDSDFWMKIKGEKHSSSKVKTIAAVDTEKIENLKEFVDSVVTNSRCLQSLTKLKEINKPLNRSSLGDYIRWIYNDVIKEETDTIVTNSIDVKALGGALANKARQWFFENELKFDELL